MDNTQLIHIFHIIIAGGLFLYVGINKEKISKTLFTVLFWFGLLIMLYHSYKAYNYMKLDKGYWINLIHILLIGPLLIYIGYNEEKTARRYFEIVLMVGFSTIGYHGYYLINK